ncbi:hypothetical protein [Candidatus Chlamydia sanziniae]|uniref:hypothetical protein n=1 Tax=Candidatus Chlamydia sanziniae TaxID=1806891 RepID=UPI0012E8CECF|nr:hypothetical protein [Candidatus Chlamydia sanziniae]
MDKVFVLKPKRRGGHSKISLSNIRRVAFVSQAPSYHIRRMEFFRKRSSRTNNSMSFLRTILSLRTFFFSVHRETLAAKFKRIAQKATQVDCTHYIFGYKNRYPVGFLNRTL